MAWNLIQSAVGAATGTPGTTKPVTYSFANVSSGTKLIAYVSTSTQTGTSTAVATVKDGAGNSFTLVGRKQVGTSPILTDISAWAIDTPAGDVGTKPTITATLGTGTANMGILVQEVGGLAVGNTLAAMIDGTLQALSGTGGASTGSPAYSSTAVNEYLVSVYGDDGGPETWTKPAALTADTNSTNSNADSNTAVAYGNSTNGAEAGSWALTGTTADWCTLLVAFKLASTGITGTGSIALPTGKFAGTGSFSPPAAVTGTGGIRLPSMAVFGSSARRLILSIAPTPGTDGFGNPYPEGISVGAKGSQQVQILINGTEAILAFPSGASFENIIAELAAGIVGIAPAQFVQLFIQSASVLASGSNDQVAIAFNSAAADGSSFANMELLYKDNGGTYHLYAFLDATGFKITTGLIAGIHPGTTPAVAETWQSLGTFGAASWTINEARYRIDALGQCEIDISLNAQTGGGASGLFVFTNTLPAGYQFAGNYSRAYAFGFNGVITTGANQGYMLVDGAGTGAPGRVRIGLPALPATTNMSLTVGIPLS